ncbi:MAG: NAD-binding protein [Chloroflexota bacterium]|nr:NAD-binding protein [Chloroflexota bacterium]
MAEQPNPMAEQPQADVDGQPTADVDGQPHAVVIGDLEVARRACSELVAHGFEVSHLLHPSDLEMRAALTPAVSAVAILVRGDVTALRYALLVEHLLPGVRLVVTLFDRTVAEQLVRVVPNCEVTSPANVAVPSIIGACVGPGVLAVASLGGEPTMVLASGEGIELRQWPRRSWRRRLRGALAGQVRAHDAATRILLIGLSGLASILVLDWFLTVTALHENGVRGLYTATRVVATVGPGDADAHAPAWYQVLSSVLMLLTIVFTAVFTAGVINRLLSSRSFALIGSRTVPTRDHVVVIGLGQVGLRLCIELRRLGIGVVCVERDPRAVNLRLARAAKVPVLIAHAEDRAILNKLSLPRARALAAMGAEDLDNIEVAIAALAVAPDLRVVLRAGDDDVITETRSLFRIGDVRNVSALTAFAVTLGLVGKPPRAVYARGLHLGAVQLTATGSGTIPDPELHSPATRCDCAGVGD